MACFSTDLPRDDQSKTKLKTASIVIRMASDEGLKTENKS